MEDTQLRKVEGTIAYFSLGRATYAFDIYSLTVPASIDSLSLNRLSLHDSAFDHLQETRLTDGKGLNYNAHLVEESQRAAVLEHLKGQGLKVAASLGSASGDLLAHVSENTGIPDVYFSFAAAKGVEETGTTPIQLGALFRTPKVCLRDRPSVAGGRVVYVSSQDALGSPRQSWNAVFATDLKTGVTNRLTPQGVTDFILLFHPQLVMVASNQGRGWKGEIESLCLDLYMLSAIDGSQRRLVVKNGGWPSWADDATVYFHRLADDGWWSIFKVTLSAEGPSGAERVTPPGLHAFTPAASRTGRWIAVATRRPNFDFRHIEIFDLESKNFTKLTELVTSHAHHYNPFVFPNSERVGYHRCRQIRESSEIKRGVPSTPYQQPYVEFIWSPLSHVSLLHVCGAFPAISPDGSLIAYVPVRERLSPGIYVMKLDGTGKRKVFDAQVFGIVWDPVKKGVLYTSCGPFFASEDKTVHIIAINNADVADHEANDSRSTVKTLTKEGTLNNAFPALSPDGKFIVFRSGRSGRKNLYIMDAAEGEGKYLRQLTEGAWSDTMPNWSPDNRWIAFCSDRHNHVGGTPPGEGNFALYYVHPDGTGLHRVLGGDEGRVNHPWFSPDSKSIVFTSDLAGLSAEPISMPHQFQPYGEIFVSKADGTEMQRLTHNAYENGTPTWGPTFLAASDVAEAGESITGEVADSVWLRKSGNENNPTMCGQ